MSGVRGRWRSRTDSSSSIGRCRCWRLYLRGDEKKGADRGIDGVVHFLEGPTARTMQKAIVQVKSGKVSSPHIRDLKGTVEREEAALGLFITLEESDARDGNEKQ